MLSTFLMKHTTAPVQLAGQPLSKSNTETKKKTLIRRKEASDHVALLGRVAQKQGLGFSDNCLASHCGKAEKKTEKHPWVTPCLDIPGWGGEGSGAGDVPKRREMMLRFGGGAAAGGAGVVVAGRSVCGC